ncbi:helix-turn-helix domain-containing protein [Lactococcus cremoris]|uniref:HTH cro/C1-type domain-containing protein n=1 Tax=Lactococcus lactis subsp. cremoris TaxID=1359 RepID=A0AAD1K2T4_LACLC|nr:S24 family peptidase [Lactococcus cremoris]MBU8903574.1 helix-turn-helix domain-containing protein [Lactococcus cremoris]MCT0465697.1 helix-turn-helix domain-containing protein [Lactococcus cremoris]MCT0487990.1 helix-turn-helix domain-containing protein [Lactococcus cremoris]MCT4431169.1 helix-turn-helix domain-containing protein [Lactococcus cremoris]MCT4454322.1 helix-turn-helix domain-containing protein [Lactococcus cremoris]
MDDREINKFVGMKIKEFRKNKKLTQQDLADLVGVKNSAISNYEQGIRIPKRDFLFRVANALGVSIDEFFPIQSEETSSTLSEINKISSQLEETRQKIVLETANHQLDEQIKKKRLSFFSNKVDFDKISNIVPYDPNKEGYAPVIGEIAAGTPILSEQNFEGMRPVYGKYAGRDDIFWLRVKGESMETEIHDGSFALILQDPDLSEGSIGAVRFIDDNEATLKCVFYEYDENGYPLCLRLEPLNPDYPIQYADEYNPAVIEGRLVKVEQDY